MDFKTPRIQVILMMLLCIMVIPGPLHAQFKILTDLDAEFKVFHLGINQSEYSLVTHNQLQNKHFSRSQYLEDELRLWEIQTGRAIGPINTIALVAPVNNLRKSAVFRIELKRPSVPATKENFFKKNKYWLFGAAAVILTSTVLIVSTGNGSSDNAPDFPIPPGRPNI